MPFKLGLFLIIACMWSGMLLFLEFGRRVGAQRIAANPAGAQPGTSTVERAIFALMGLLIAFTFSEVTSRFDARRHLIVEETNAIGTAYLRLDLLAAETQPPLRSLFRQYLESRIQVYRRLPDIEASNEALAKSTRLQREIWTEAVSACKTTGSQPASVLLFAALNQMIDITTTRAMATRMLPPTVILVLLFSLGLSCSFLAGYSMAGSKERSWIHIIGFVTATAMILYVILDIEYPRFGIIRVDAFDLALEELLNSMK